MQKEIIDYLEDKIIEDIKTYDIQKKSQFNDYVIIGTAKNERQLEGLLNSIKKDFSHKIIKVDSSSDWLVIDLNEVIVHIFTTTTREEYNLERIFENE